jgi:hypothetical protein
LLPIETANLETGFYNDSNAHRIGETFYIGMDRLAATVRDAVPTKTLGKFCKEQDAAGERCARATTIGFGLALSGKAMADDQVNKIVAVNSAHLASNTHERSLRAIVETLLQLPSFLYRTEFGERWQGQGMKLTGPELAAAMATLLWQSAPDEALRMAGVAGKLGSPDGLKSQLERMLKQPRARASFSSFVTDWLGLRSIDKTLKDPRTFPDFNAQVPADFMNETRGFSERVLFDGDGSLKTLLTSDTT